MTDAEKKANIECTIEAVRGQITMANKIIHFANQQKTNNEMYLAELKQELKEFDEPF